jgi:hypothetical protein
MTLARISLLLIATCSIAPSLGCGDTLDELAGDGDATFTSIYEQIGSDCSECHAPGAPGRTAGIESTQNWSTRASALSSLRGDASGLIGNFAGCNGEPLLRSSADQSLLVASLDDDVRANFESPDNPDCNGDAVSDQNLKLGSPLSGSVLQNLKDWVDSGAPDN